MKTSILRLLRDAILSTALYAAFVGGGLFLLLLVASAVGYLPYSDRPGPGWYGAHLPTLTEIRFYLGFVAFFVVVFLAFWGLILFALARVLGLLHMPKWLIGSICCVLAGAVSLIGVDAAGWYVAIAALPVYVSGILGAVFGAIALPRFARTRPAESRRAWYWAAAFLPLLAVTGLLIYPMLPDKDAQSLQLITVRLVKGDASLDSTQGSALTTEEFALLNSLGLKGTLHSGSVESVSMGNEKEARVVIVLTDRLAGEVDLPEPKQTRVIYVQTGPKQFQMYPQGAPTLRRKIKLQPAEEGGYEGLTVAAEPVIGKPSRFTWYPPIPAEAHR